MNWLSKALSQCSLTEEVEEYLLSRGTKESLMESEGMVTWTIPEEPIPDTIFVKRYGERGELLRGMSICPIWSPRGEVIGFEGRSIHKKYIADFRMSDTSWQPFWLGLHGAMPKIWAGGDIWIGEGLFDITALEWAIPETDAVLASVRAKLSHNHVKFLKRYCKGQVNMVYDRDEAGRHGVLGYTDSATGKHRWGALDVLRREGIRCRDVVYQGGKDPGEIWDRGGAKAIQKTFPI